MADERELTVQFLGEEGVVIEFPAENMAVSVPYTQVGDDLYPLDGIPFGVDLAGRGAADRPVHARRHCAPGRLQRRPEQCSAIITR
jgi:hypothetical protein